MHRHLIVSVHLLQTIEWRLCSSKLLLLWKSQSVCLLPTTCFPTAASTQLTTSITIHLVKPLLHCMTAHSDENGIFEINCVLTLIQLKKGGYEGRCLCRITGSIVPPTKKLADAQISTASWRRWNRRWRWLGHEQTSTRCPQKGTTWEEKERQATGYLEENCGGGDGSGGLDGRLVDTLCSSQHKEN